jgi:hypothetical protein
MKSYVKKKRRSYVEILGEIQLFWLTFLQMSQKKKKEYAGDTPIHLKDIKDHSAEGMADLKEPRGNVH